MVVTNMEALQSLSRSNSKWLLEATGARLFLYSRLLMLMYIVIRFLFSSWLKRSYMDNGFSDSLRVLIIMLIISSGSPKGLYWAHIFGVTPSRLWLPSIGVLD